jgi:hypothetical protein
MDHASTAAKIRAEYPLLADNEGVWEGIYRYYDAATGKLTDQHLSRLICRLTDDPRYTYHQTNYYFWADGRTETREFPAWYENGRIWWDNDLIKGWAAAMQDPKGRGRSLSLRDDPELRRPHPACPHLAVVPQRQMLLAHADRRDLHHPGLADLDRHVGAENFPGLSSFVLKKACSVFRTCHAPSK